jgi:predicted nucleic acid-binding protein
VILVDTSVWSGYFRNGDSRLAHLLRDRQVVIHPWIVGELMLGPGMRDDLMDDLRQMPAVGVVRDEEVMDFIRLHNFRGIGWVDTQILLAALINKIPLWTRDQSLKKASLRFELQA